MTVRQLSNGSWIADRSINGNRHTRTVSTQEEAQYWDLKFQYEYGSAYMTADELNKPGPTLSDFIEDVFWPKKKNLRTRTVRTYKKSINNDILPSLGNVPCNKITPAMVQDMINRCTCRRVAEQAREALSSILSLLVDGRIYSINPASLHFTYPPPLGRGSRKGIILSRYFQHEKLLAHVARHHPGEPIERQIVLGLCLGLRPEEVYGVDWENVSLSERTILIDQVLVSEGGKHLEPPKTDKGLRKLPIPEYAFGRMLTWCQTPTVTFDLRGNEAHAVVTNRFGDRACAQTCIRNLEKLRAESYDDGTPIPHITQWSLRHSYGTAAAIDGKIEVELLRDLMGHEDSATTKRYYIIPQLDDLRSAVDTIDSFYPNLSFPDL